MSFRLPSSSFRFLEIDHFNEVGLGWDVEYRQLGRGQLNADLAYITSPSLSAVHLTLGNVVHQRACDPPGTRTFSFLAPDCPRYLWCGQEVGPGQILCSDSLGGFESVSPAGFDGLALTLDNSLLKRIAEKMGETEHIETLTAGTALTVSDVHRMSNFLRQLMHHLAAQSELCECDIYEEFVRLVSDTTKSARPGRLGIYSTLISKAIPYIEEHAQNAIGVSDLSAALGTTNRTLERAFKEKLGATPRSTIKKIRLDGARYELAKAYASETISQVAGRWGFWHMGDFSREYFREFGELPKETICRGRRHFF